jgi:hypothetical protein
MAITKNTLSNIGSSVPGSPPALPFQCGKDSPNGDRLGVLAQWGKIARASGRVAEAELAVVDRQSPVIRHDATSTQYSLALEADRGLL